MRLRHECGRWAVEDVVAHLTAAARIGRLRWITSVLGARFDFDVHNERRLAEHRGPTTEETLDRFRRTVTSTTAASGHTASQDWQGYAHGELYGLEHTPQRLRQGFLRPATPIPGLYLTGQPHVGLHRLEGCAGRSFQHPAIGSEPGPVTRTVPRELRRIPAHQTADVRASS